MIQHDGHVWMTEALHVIEQLPTHEQEAAAKYVIDARGLPPEWSRWQLEIQSVFELFLDAPLESFDATHRYALYVMPDESGCQQLVEALGYRWTPEHTPNPSVSEVTEKASHFDRLPGDHPTSFYTLAPSGHLVFDNDEWIRSRISEYPSVPSAEALCTFEDARLALRDVPFFYRSADGRTHWWYNAALLFRVQTDGSLFDALWRAFHMDDFAAPRTLTKAVCIQARVELDELWLEPYKWHHDVVHTELRQHLSRVLGEADGPWEQRARVFREARFGDPPGNAGCPLRISGHCSPRWPRDWSSEDDPGIGQFGGGLDELESYVRGIASWVYAVHGNSKYGGMCIVECSGGLEEEVAPHPARREAE